VRNSCEYYFPVVDAGIGMRNPAQHIKEEIEGREP